MSSRPELKATSMCPSVETAVSARISRYGLEKIVRTIGIDRLVGLLAIVTGAGKVVIQQSRDDLVTDNGLHSGFTHIDFPPFVIRGPHNRFRGHFGLKDRRHGLRMARQPSS